MICFFKGRQIEICFTVSIIFVLTVAKIKRKIPNNDQAHLPLLSAAG